MSVFKCCSIDRATGYVLMAGIRLLAAKIILSVLHKVHTNSEGHPASYSMCIGGSFPEGKEA
jgi:hypothetical protein